MLHVFSSIFYQTDSTAWHQWRKFYGWMCIPFDLQGAEDPVHFLQIFYKRVHVGLLVDSRIPIKKRSMEHYPCSLGKILSDLGASNPQHNNLVKLYFFLG